MARKLLFLWGFLLILAGSTSGELFTGEFYDDAIQLQYNRNRWYSATVGQFISPDKLTGTATEPLSLNRYNYAAPNPLLYIDPSGDIVTLAEISFANFTQSYSRTRSANNAFNTFQRIENTLCKTMDKVTAPFDQHHRIPKFLGGAEKQPLIDIAPELHNALHKLLGIALVLNGFPSPNRGRNAFEQILKGKKGKRGDVNKIILDVASYMDKACILVQGYKPIEPRIKSVLKIASFFDF